MNPVSDSTPRANRLGDPCPSWCAEDHDMVIVEATEAHSAIYADSHLSGSIGSGVAGEPYVYLHDIGNGAEITVSAGATITVRDDAEGFAAFIGHLALCTPDMIQRLADEIRYAAGIIAGDGTS